MQRLNDSQGKRRDENVYMDAEMIEQLKILGTKEALLANLITWLKAKGLYEEAMKDCGELPTAQGVP